MCQALVNSAMNFRVRQNADNSMTTYTHPHCGGHNKLLTHKNQTSISFQIFLTFHGLKVIKNDYETGA
jgi:hypothetical protein